MSDGMLALAKSYALIRDAAYPDSEGGAQPQMAVLIQRHGLNSPQDQPTVHGRQTCSCSLYLPHYLNGISKFRGWITAHWPFPPVPSCFPAASSPIPDYIDT